MRSRRHVRRNPGVIVRRGFLYGTQIDSLDELDVRRLLPSKHAAAIENREPIDLAVSAHGLLSRLGRRIYIVSC